MRKKIIQSLILIFLASGLYISAFNLNKKINSNQMIVKSNFPTAGVIMAFESQNISIEVLETTVVKQSENIEEIKATDVLSQPLVFPNSYYNPEKEEFNEEEFWDDMELVALVCVAEAEGESEYGKRLVIDTILNRLESPYFPNRIYDVINAPGQYECIHNGRINRVEYDEYIASLVIEEFNNRTNSEVIYFRTNQYFNFGTPLLQEGNHYFSKR